MEPTILLGALGGLCGGALWGRALSPRVTWLPVLALGILTGLGVWLTAVREVFSADANAVAAFLTVLSTPFFAAHYLREAPAYRNEAYSSRLRMWLSPSRRAAPDTTEAGD